MHKGRPSRGKTRRLTRAARDRTSRATGDRRMAGSTSTSSTLRSPNWSRCIKYYDLHTAVNPLLGVFDEDYGESLTYGRLRSPMLDTFN